MNREPIHVQIDPTCEAFEDAWRCADRPDLRLFLANCEERVLPVLFDHLLAIEIDYRRQAGEQPTATEYRSRFPEFAHLIATAFGGSPETNSAPQHESSATTAGDDTAGYSARVMGKFRLLHQIGAGAFGAVWKGIDTELGRTVAVKVLHPGLNAAVADRERFLREARAAAQLRHPGIVTIHDVAEYEGCPAIVSEFIAGVSLQELLRVRRLDFREAATLIADVASALDYAHGMKLVHRDVKPANIMIEFGPSRSLGTSLDHSASTVPSGKRATDSAVGTAPSSGSGGKPPAARGVDSGSPSDSSSQGAGPRTLVLDFGLALRDDAEATMTVDGQILGTPSYMSPEQAAGRGHHVDRRSDVYSLGVILYELLTGGTPFRGSKIAVLHQVLHEDPRPPRALNPLIPRDLETICLKAMSKQGGGRYETAGDLAADLRRWLRDEPILARRPTRWEQFRRWTRRNPSVAIALSVIGVLLASSAIAASAIAVRFRKLADERANALAAARGERDAAEEARQEAREAARQERVARTLSDDALVEMRTAFGLLTSDLKQPARGLPWFAAAAELPQSDRTRALANQLRFQNWGRVIAQTVRARIYSGADPSDEVRRLEWHPGGRWLLAQALRSLAVWDVSTDTLVTVPAGQQASAGAAATELQPTIGAWSPDGRWLAVCRPAPNRIDLIDVREDESSAWRVVNSWDIESGANVLEFSDDGRWLAMGSTGVRIVDCEQGALIAELEHPSRVYAVKFDRAGERIVTGCEDGMARLWRIASNAPPSLLLPPLSHPGMGGIESCTPQFAGFDRELIVLGEDAEPLRVNSVTGNQSKLGAGPGQTSFLVAPSQVLAATIAGNFGRLHSLATGAPSGAPLTHTNTIYQISFHPEEKVVATSGGDRTVRVWSALDGSPHMPPIVHPGDLRCVAFAPQGRYLASAELHGMLRVWELPSVYRTIHVGGSDGHLELSPDGRHVFPGPWQSHRVSLTTQAFSLATGAMAGPQLRLGTLVNGSYFAPDGRRAVVLAAAEGAPVHEQRFMRPEDHELERHGGQVVIWDWHTGRELGPRVRTPSEPIGAAWHPDATRIGVICAGGQVLLLDADSGQLLAQADQGANFSPFFVTRGHIRFAPDGQSLVTWLDSSVRAWEVPSLAPRYALRINSQFTHDTAFSADGRWLAVAGSDLQLRVLSHATGEPAVPAIVHPDWVFTAQFNSDATRIVTACRDGMARIWDWQQGKLACAGMAHQDEVFCATFTPDDRWVVTASRDATVRLWNGQSGKPVSPPLEMPDWVYDVRVTPDGELAVAGGRKQQVWVIPLRAFLTPDPRQLDAASHSRLAEIISGQTLRKGGAVNLTSTEWFDRWRRFSSEHPDYFRYQIDGSTATAGAAAHSQSRLRLNCFTTWGRWDAAARELQAILARPARPGEEERRFRAYFELTALRAHLGDREGYRHVCERMLEEYREYALASPRTCEQIAKSCLLGETPQTRRNEAIEFAAAALARTSPDLPDPWFTLTRALAYLRADDLPNCRAQLAKLDSVTPDNYFTASRWAIAAIAARRSGEQETTTRALNSARDIIARNLPQPERGRFYEADWSDWVRCLVLMQEAERE